MTEASILSVMLEEGGIGKEGQLVENFQYKENIDKNQFFKGQLNIFLNICVLPRTIQG